MIVNGRIIYSRAGWIRGQHAGTCCLCGKPYQPGDKVIRVAAHHHGGNWAATCCAAAAEERSGYWHYRPNAPKES